MIEDDFLPRDLSLAAPVAALRKVSYDLSLRHPLELADGSTMTALEIQWEYFDRAKKYAEDHGLECVGGAEVGDEVLRRWEEVLTGLETDPMTLVGQLDWVAKHRLIDGYRERARPRVGRRPPGRHGPAVPRPAARASASPGRVGLERLTTDAEVDRAVTEPPPDTRAYFRGKCLQRWAIPDRGRQLGFPGVRHRRRPAAAGADDGTDTWNRGARG